MEDKKLPGTGEPKFSDIKKEAENSKLGKWFDNFWYHYKIHTIIGAVAVITLFICITQMITRDEYDYQLMYAGPQVIALQDRTYMEDAVEAIADDYNGDGKIVVVYDDIVMLSPEEQKKAMENGAVFNGEFNMNSMTEYYQQIFGGDAVICLLSPYMYGVVREGDGFLPLSEVFETVPDSAYDDYGISLLKTEFGQYFNGINDLPDDTILCVRRLSTMATFKGQEKTKKAHEANLDLFRKMVEFRAPVDDITNEDTTELAASPDVVTVTGIVDRTQTESIPTDQALEWFWSDDKNEYFFPSIRSQYITVFYSDGTSENVVVALEMGNITLADLDLFGIQYYPEPIIEITQIIDSSDKNQKNELDVEEYFWEDTEYKYYFPNPMSDYIIVEYSDGSTENIKQALEEKRAHISDLDRFEIQYYAEPKIKDIEYNSTFIRADSMSDGGAFTAFMKYCENPSMLAISSVQHILVAHFGDMNEFSGFTADISEYYQTDILFAGEESFLEKAAEYDEAFFKENDLLILHLPESSGSIRHEIEFVRGRKSPLVYVCIERIVPEVMTADMACWFAFIEVPKSDIETALDFDAWYK